MTLTKLLNRCYRFKGFVYEEAGFSEQRANAIEVQVRPRKGSRPYCSGCGKRTGAYDRLPERSFEFIPVWGFAVFFCYARRRVDCRELRRSAKPVRLYWAEPGRSDNAIAHRTAGMIECQKAASRRCRHGRWSPR